MVVNSGNWFVDSIIKLFDEYESTDQKDDVIQSIEENINFLCRSHQWIHFELTDVFSAAKSIMVLHRSSSNCDEAISELIRSAKESYSQLLEAYGR